LTASLSPLFSWRGAIASKESGLAPTLRHVALTLSLHMSEKGDSCFPSVSLLVDESGLAESTVRDSLRKLCDLGWLVKEARFRADGGQTSSVYCAATPNIEPPHREPVAPPPGDGEPPTASPVPVEVVNEVVKESAKDLDASRRAVGKPTTARQANDALFQSMVIACGMNYDEMTDRQRKACGVAMAELRRVNATPDEVEHRAEVYRQMFDAVLTPNALASQWAMLRAAPPPTVKANGADAILQRVMERNAPPPNVVPIRQVG